jgi:hypothetical protein
MTGFLDINRVYVPREIVLEGHRFLRLTGKQHMEGICLWVGYREGTNFIVSDLLIPHQRGVSSESGLCAIIHGDELARIGRMLYEAKKLLFGQLHTHPTEAYHSVTDDENSIVTAMGGVSLVIPDFAVRPFNLNDCASYRLDADGVWAEMAPDTAADLIRIEGA